MHDHFTVNHLSLCTGIGGIDLGLREVVAGCRTIACVEIEAFAAANLVAKMEAGALDSCPVYSDIHSFPWERYRGLVDILSGGFPCQPFSNAGRRKGVDDPRHLWPQIKDGINAIRPRAVFFENVDGISTAKSPGYESVLHNVLCDLEELGYRATAGCFTAEECGAPHLRKRWFILGVEDTCSAAFGGFNQQTGGETGFPNVRQGNRSQRPVRTGATGQLADALKQGSQRHPWDEHFAIGQAGERSNIGSAGKGGLQRWPAYPGEEQHEWEPPRTIESGMGFLPDGLRCNRVDALRALGNAVVPQVAAKAFYQLWNELNETENLPN